ncbi:uncharacterized protein VTP21DRAFT_9137 [Calcarisporiella thermophila]|uniref:uncharacterized protein n=1 Tax=Calcarisporiella thermophila TaxID=911321 RepID=UPI003742C79C
MPLIEIKSNVEPDNLELHLSSLTKNMAKSLGKPEQIMSVSFEKVFMLFGGSTDPTASVKVYSIGSLSSEQNKVHCQIIFKFLQEVLNVDKGRAYIAFIPLERTHTGFRGTTVDDLIL